MVRHGGAPFFYLRADETVLLKLEPRPEWALAMFTVFFMALTLVQAVAINAVRFVFVQVPAFVVPAIWATYAGLLVVAALVSWRRWATSEYALTESRIYARHGRLRTTVHFTTHDRITDIRYHQGPLERPFGISRIMFATAGGDVSVLGIRDAIAFKEAAESARDAFLQRLLERAGIEEQARAEKPVVAYAPVLDTVDGAEPAAAPVEAASALPPLPVWSGSRPDYLKTGDVPVWFGKPRLIASVSALLPFVGILPFVILGSFSGFGVYAGPAIALLAVGAIAWRALQLSRMEYTVTDKRVYTRSGVLGTTVTQLTYDKITDITYRQDILGRILGFGGVTVNTAGSNHAPASMAGLEKPLELKAIIEAARSRYLREDGE